MRSRPCFPLADTALPHRLLPIGHPVITSQTMKPTSTHITALAKSPKTLPRNTRGATTCRAKYMRLSTSPPNTKEHQLIMLTPPAMTVAIQRHIPMCPKTSAPQGNNHRFANLTCLLQLSAHWKGEPMLLRSHRSTTKTTTTTTTIMIGELDHLRLLSTYGFANLNQMKSVLGA